MVLLLVPATLSWFNDLSNRMVSFKTLVFIFSPQRYGTQHNTTGSYQVVVTVVRGNDVVQLNCVNGKGNHIV